MFSAFTTMSRRRLNASLFDWMKSFGPFSPSTAAAWLIVQVALVDCDCNFDICEISAFGPPAKPMRQPVIA